MEPSFRYDAVIKDLFAKDHPTLLDKLVGGRTVRSFVSTDLPVVVSRVADLLLQLDDGTMLHLDFQGANDGRMVYREGMYAILIAEKYRCRKLEQVVIYMGRQKMRMVNKLDLGDVKIKYRLIDIREFPVSMFLKSGRPGDYALAILARGGVDKMREIVERANQLPEASRHRALAQLALLAGLRRASKRLKMEFKAMGINVDIQENVFLKDAFESGESKGRMEGRVEGKAEGKAEGMVLLLRGQLETRFGPLPRWANDRLMNASPADAEAWSKKVLVAKTLEGVLGKK